MEGNLLYATSSLVEGHCKLYYLKTLGQHFTPQNLDVLAIYKIRNTQITELEKNFKILSN